MKEYRTLDVIKVELTKVGLNKDQAARRDHVLKKTKQNGVYEVFGPLSFKVGEVFKADEKDIGKVNLQKIEEVKKSEK